MQARRKNMERMADVVPDSDELSLQYFISNAEWDTTVIITQVAQAANVLPGAPQKPRSLIDESGF